MDEFIVGWHLIRVAGNVEEVDAHSRCGVSGKSPHKARAIVGALLIEEYELRHALQGMVDEPFIDLLGLVLEDCEDGKRRNRRVAA